MSDPMDRDVDEMLDRWIDAVAPERAPTGVLEGTFARTMTTSQARPVPWRRIRIGSPPNAAFASLAWVALVVIVAIVVLAVALLSGGGEPLMTKVAPSASATASPSPLASPGGPPPISVAPEATITVEQPLYMGTDGAVPWLITEAGELVRIDPATNSIGASGQIGPPGDPYQGLAADADAVWVTDWITRKIFRVDPDTLEVAETITAGAGAKGVIVTDAGVWVADTRGGAVMRIDPSINDVAATVNVGPTGAAGPNWLAAGAESVWVDVPNNNTVARIDPLSDTVQATINAPEGFIPCGGIAAGTDAVWVTGCAAQKRLIVIDAATDTVRATLELDGFGYYPTMIDGAPWVSLNREREDNGQIVRIDPVSDLVDRVVVPGTTFHGGGNLVVAAGSVWVYDALHDNLLRLPLSAFAS
jgi:streptogramin lyase